MIYFLYTESGEYQGCTAHPEKYPELNKTQTEPPEYDETTQHIVFQSENWVIYDY